MADINTGNRRTARRPISVVAAWAAALLSALCTRGLAHACTKDTDCKGDRICIEQRCVDPPAAPARCSSDKDCPGDEICEDNVCADPSVPGGGPSPSGPTSRGASTPTKRVEAPAVVVRPDPSFRFPSGSIVLVLPFRDNPSGDRRDREGTGRAVQVALFDGLESVDELDVRMREGQLADPSREIGDAEATRLVRESGADFAVVGACTDFYRVAPFTFRRDRAAVSLRIVSAAGVVVFQESWKASPRDNLAEPEAALRLIAKELRKRVRPD